VRKIPTLFMRDFTEPSNGRYVTTEVNPACQWVLDGEGIATRKYDGTCVMLDGTKWWARREVKPGKVTPANFQAVETDDVTGKTVGWEPIEQSAFAHWFREAFQNDPRYEGIGGGYAHGTYELIGPKVNGNPELAVGHQLVLHEDAQQVRVFSLTFDGIRDTVILLAKEQGFEGLVWHHPDGRMAKIKRKDFSS
jgi:hypothetical protein